MEKRIMSVITDAMDKVQANFDQITTALTGISAGIANLDQLITNLQNSPGTLSPADQTALDNIQAASGKLVAQVQAISTEAPGVPVAPAQNTASSK